MTRANQTPPARRTLVYGASMLNCEMRRATRLFEEQTVAWQRRNGLTVFEYNKRDTDPADDEG